MLGLRGMILPGFPASGKTGVHLSFGFNAILLEGDCAGWYNSGRSRGIMKAAATRCAFPAARPRSKAVFSLSAFLCFSCFLWLFPLAVLADTHYVSLSGSHVSPFTNWVDAATNIQAAVDVATAADVVLVTNGVYVISAEIVVSNNIDIASVNGAEVTTVAGDGSCRCFNLGSGFCLLNGFTITNGATSGSGGGIYCGNRNPGILNCVIARNSADGDGGGLCGGSLGYCTLTGNSAGSWGGGAFNATLDNCTLTGNSAELLGGGSGFSTLNNCILARNSAGGDGGGASYGTLNNCTLTGNSAGYSGGGSFEGTFNNCIMYYNSALFGPNYNNSTFRYSCTLPHPGGTGNITDPPVLVSFSHITADSPCRAAGSAAYASGTDIDGELWLPSPSIGCDEPIPGAITGSLSVAIGATYTNVMTGFTVEFTALIQGRVSTNMWDFGDGTPAISNRVFISHAFKTAGLYDVELRACNESYPLGAAATVTVQVVTGIVHYVNPGSSTPAARYTSWATAATNIQDAVDAADVPGAVVLVTNGVYNAGGRAVVGVMTNRLAIDQPVTVRSVNGPAVTVIKGKGPLGNGAVRCVYVGPNAVLEGFTLTDGCTRTNGVLFDRERSGGGVWCEKSAVVNNCTLTGNSADSSAGGSFGGTLNNCMIIGNSANGNGGGSYYGALNNCTLTGNLSGGGGGSFAATLNNCIIYYNSASIAPNWIHSSPSYCCSPDLTNGVNGNITNAPQFVDVATSNYHLRATSPCIDAGANADWMSNARDLDGDLRIFNGVVDIGAYEFTMHTDAKAVLGGPYNTNTHIMANALQQAGYIPTNAIYGVDRRERSAMPSNTTDWVLLQLLRTNDLTSIVAKSVFLRSDGQVVNDDGSIGIRLECSPGYYYLVAKHRNHIAAMSAQPLAYTNEIMTYDFTTNWTQYRGGTNACVQLEPGVWGMISGDADGDGKITHVDRKICEEQQGQTGYKAGDFNLDGVVDGND